jgi:hypothetical protein
MADGLWGSFCEGRKAPSRAHVTTPCLLVRIGGVFVVTLFVIIIIVIVIVNGFRG